MGEIKRKRKRSISSLPYVIIYFVGFLCVAAVLRNSLRLYSTIQYDPSKSPLHLGSPNAAKEERCNRKRTLKDIQSCFPSRFVRQLGPGCEKVETWPDVQRCLNRRFVAVPNANATSNNANSDHYTVHILGERNSGTKFVMRELQACFPRNSSVGTVDDHDSSHQPPSVVVKVHRDYIRAKHWFQPITADNWRNHILVVVFRDSVEWVAALREKPYHSPRHVRRFEGANGQMIVPLDWRSFVSREWSTARTDHDHELQMNQTRRALANRGEVCREGFAYHQVVPCRFDNSTSIQVPLQRLRGFEPIYELRRDGSGQPFRNILELRAEKIVNFLLELPVVVDLGGFLAVRYEDLLREGTGPMLQQVATMVGRTSKNGALPGTCQAGPPQPERLGKRLVDPEFRDYILSHVEPGPEKLLGYI